MGAGVISAARRRGPAAVLGNPNYYRTAILIDATGQANGTGYNHDETRNNWALTYNGSAAIASQKFEFNGTTDFITAPHSILWTPGSMFTMIVLGLVFDAVNTGTSQGVVTHYSAGGSNISWDIQEGAGTLNFNFSTSGTSTTTGIVIGSVVAGVSYDVVVCWDGAHIYTLLNGVPGGSTAFTGNIFDSPQVLRFGAMATGGTADQFLDGRFAAFAYSRGEALAAQSTSYSMPSLPLSMDNPALTDSNWGSVLALIGYDTTISRIRDFGPYDLPLAVNGNAAGSAVVTLADGSGSISFDGSGDSITIADDPLLEPGAGPLTVECFSRHAVVNVQHDLVTKYNASGSRRCLLFDYVGSGTQHMEADLCSSGGAIATTVSANYTETANVFSHKALSWAGSVGGTARVFAGGTLLGSATFAANLFDSSIGWTIGSRGGGGSDMNGYETQIRITKANRYTASFTPPTGALPIG